MKPIKHALWMALLLSACGGNPFLVDNGDVGNGPPGTEGPVGSKGSAITRTEKTVKTSGKDYGNGFAEGFVYNEADDTFSVDGLAFDGANVYQRGTTVSDIGPFQVYEGDSTYTDGVTGANIDQDAYRAIYGASTNGKTSFAIVRTGSYVPYGFGGFIYSRSGGVTLPASSPAGQFAHYDGAYAGLRDFNGTGGLEYVTGDMAVDINFDDFNDGAGVRGEVTNRAIFDIDNTDITQDVIDAINVEYGTALDALPTLVFAVGPGALKETGEASGSLGSRVGTDTFETGKYYALIANTDDINAGEVVGVIVVESPDPRTDFDGVTTRETGGFILYR